jgi:hypothetical protein
LECPARHEDALHRSGWSGAISPQPNVWLLQTISHRHRSPALNGVQTEYTGKTRWSKNTSKINYWRTHPQILPLRPSLSRNLRLIRIEADQAYTADRHRPVTTEHGRLHERSRLVAPHFHNAFLCVHTTSPSEFSVHTGRIGALLRRLGMARSIASPTAAARSPTADWVQTSGTLSGSPMCSQNQMLDAAKCARRRRG